MKCRWKKTVVFFLAMCMMVSSLNFGGFTIVHATGEGGGETNSSCSTLVHSHAMDTTEEVVNGYLVPTGWRRIAGYFSQCKVETEGDRTYYLMKNGDTTASACITYDFSTEETVGTKASLKYSVMVDNGAIQEGAKPWLVNLPTLGTGNNTRFVNLMVRNYELNIGNGAGFKTLEKGQWYDIEIVLDVTSGAWTLYVNDDEVQTGTSTNATTISCVTMGIQGGDGFTTNAIGFCVDELSVYTETATVPTAEPTTEPTAAPTAEPTAEPTTEPTAAPTTEPTAAPTTEPTAAPPVTNCSTPVHSHAMDTKDALANGNSVPTGWRHIAGTYTASDVTTVGDRTCYLIKIGDVDSRACTTYDFSPVETVGTKASLKYCVMLDNGAIQEGAKPWLVQLPTLGTGNNTRFVNLMVRNYELNIGNGEGFKTLEKGQWYDIEIVLDVNSGAWTLYVDDEKVQTGTSTNATTVSCVTMGIQGGTGFTVRQIGFYVDDLKVYNHTSCQVVEASFEQEQYQAKPGEKLTPKLNVAEGVTVTYHSGNEAIITVNAETGEITPVAPGSTTIIARSEGCTLPIASATVTIVGNIIYEENFDATEVGALPQGWYIAVSCNDQTLRSLAVQKEATEDNAENKALQLDHKFNLINSMRAVRRFDNNTEVTKAVLKYNVMVKKLLGQVFLPGFLRVSDSKLVAQLSVRDGDLVKATNTGGWIDPDFSGTFKLGQWHEFEQVVDTENGVYDLYIDGNLILAQEPIVDNKVAFSGIYAGIYKNATNTMLVDDIEVTSFVEMESVSFEENAYTIIAGADATALKLDVVPADASMRTAKYTSSDEAVATVDAKGNITGLKAGTVTITATPVDTKVTPATVTVTVVEKPVTAISADNVSLHVGGHTYLNTSITPNDAGFDELEFVSSNPDVATVDEWGEVVAIGAGTATITITSSKYQTVSKQITVTVADAVIQKTIYVSPEGGGNGTSKTSPTTLRDAMTQVAAMDKTQGSIVVELADGYYKQTETLSFTKEHGGNNDHYVIYRAAEGAEVTVGGAEEFTATFTKVDGQNYYVAQLDEGINIGRHLFVNNVRATRARSEGGLNDLNVVVSENKHTYVGLSGANPELLNIPEDDQDDLECSFSIQWGNHRCGVTDIIDAGNGRVTLVMDQPGFTSVYSHSNIGVQKMITMDRPYSMFFENALILLDEPGEWYFDNDDNKLYYMPRPWEGDMSNVTLSYPVIDDYVGDDGKGGLVTIEGSDYADSMVQNIIFEGITFADTTFSRPNTNVGHSATQGQYIRDHNTSFADLSLDAAVTVKRANSIHFTECEFTRLGITGLKMVEGVQNSQIVGNRFYDISGNAIAIGDPDFTNPDICNPSDVNMMMKNCDTYNNYIHNIGVEYWSSAAISMGFVADVDSTHNEIFEVRYSPYHIGYGWEHDFKNITKNVNITNNFIHDFLCDEIWDGGGIYLLGSTLGNNVISGNYLKNERNGSAALYTDKGANNWKIANNVVDVSETPLWNNSFVKNTAIWVMTFDSNSNLDISGNYTSTAKTYAYYPRASGNAYQISAPLNEADLNDNNLNIRFNGNQVVSDLNWPAGAQTIIANSGLQEAYKDIRKNHAERISTNLPGKDEILSLSVGDTFDIGLVAKDAKDNIVTLDNSAIVAYEIEDENIATVSNDGIITAKANGETTVYVYVVSNNILQMVKCDFYVGNNIDDISLGSVAVDNTITIVTNSGGISLDPKAVTENDIELIPDTVSYVVADTSVATIDAYGVLKPVAVGTTTVEITVEAAGQTFEKVFNINVKEPLNFVLDDIEEIYKLANQADWKGSNANKVQITDDKEISAVLNGYATFTDVEYLNELMCFEFALDPVGDWPSIVLRAQDADSYVAGGTTGYIICMNPTGIELQRFNGSTRTYIYGNDPEMPGIDGPEIANNVLRDGELHKIQVGALTDGNSVRLYMTIDGEEIFNYVDSSEDAIKEAGYFGLVGRYNDTFRLVKAEDLSEYELPNLNGSETPTPGAFALDDIEEIYKSANQADWKGNDANKVQITDDKEISAVLNGYATFTGVEYLNELMCFEFALDPVGEWPSIVLRAQDADGYVAGGTTGYIICMLPTGIELQRFNGTNRTYIYGSDPGMPGIAGPEIANNILRDGELHKVQVGALTYGNSVRLYMSIDGEEIFNYVDSSKDAIKEAGYFGLVGRYNDSFRLVKAEDLSEYELPNLNGGEGTTPTPTPTPGASEEPTPTPAPSTGPEASETPDVNPEIILEGTDKSYTKGANATVSIHCTGELDDLIGVNMDGKEVDESNYTLKEGSTIVTFKAEYLETLSVGEHTVTLLYAGGRSVESTLTILATVDDNTDNTQGDVSDEDDDTAEKVADTANEASATEATVPSTGDDSNLILWIILLAVAIGTGTYMAAKKRQVK